ncbi:hypothetical protein Trydic_g10454 [Trypoxylus dichotomus]
MYAEFSGVFYLPLDRRNSKHVRTLMVLFGVVQVSKTTFCYEFKLFTVLQVDEFRSPVKRNDSLQRVLAGGSDIHKIEDAFARKITPRRDLPRNSR